MRAWRIHITRLRALRLSLHAQQTTCLHTADTHAYERSKPNCERRHLTEREDTPMRAACNSSSEDTGKRPAAVAPLPPFATSPGREHEHELAHMSLFSYRQDGNIFNKKKARPSSLPICGQPSHIASSTSMTMLFAQIHSWSAGQSVLSDRCQLLLASTSLFLQTKTS